MIEGNEEAQQNRFSERLTFSDEVCKTAQGTLVVLRALAQVSHALHKAGEDGTHVAVLNDLRVTPGQWSKSFRHSDLEVGGAAGGLGPSMRLPCEACQVQGEIGVGTSVG